VDLRGQIVLTKVRSPARALFDLVQKHENMAKNHPERHKLKQMIRQLAIEITVRNRV
jgi:hypothetical protein